MVDLPGVGHNLQDHIATFGLTWITRQSANAAYNPVRYTLDPRTYIGWKTERTGPLAATAGVEVSQFNFKFRLPSAST